MPSNYQEFSPLTELTDCIESIWVQESDDSSLAPVTTVLPIGRVELIIHYGDPFVQAAGNQYELMPMCHIVGQRDSAIQVCATGMTRIVIVRFKPAGAFVLFNDALMEMSRQIIDAALIWPQSCIDVLFEQLQAAPDNFTRISAVQHFIAARVRQRQTDSLCTAAIDHMNNGWGGYRISNIAEHFGLSRRQFTRRFTRQIGISPKKMSGVMRSQKAMACLKSGKAAHDVIDLCGFSDQSHLIHDLLLHTNHTPTGLERRTGLQLQQFFNTTDLNAFCGLAYL